MKFDKCKVCVAGLHEVPVGTRGYCANTIEQLERCVTTESKQTVETLYDTCCGYYSIHGKDYNFVGVMFYPIPEKQYRPYETMEEAIVLKGAWLKYKGGKGLLMVTSLRDTDKEVYVNGYSSQYVFDTFTFEDGSPVGVEV